MANTAAEALIGAVVLVAAGGFLAYAAQRADLGTGADGYTLVAKFRKAEGIGIGTDVRLSGVKIGSVTALTLDPETYRAVTRLAIQGGLRIPDDSGARIASEGLLGGNFVEITPGASEFMLKDGDEILQTQGSVSLLDLFLKFGSEIAPQR
ncbi:MAG: outer membrane lipid asymmetry maintenance protein MlaD [Alphaproteobacteria bacterium]|nr:MAG: outer membrane lipid asymmetry maintenance protein MlaD [Alphaproteobacteria bacterium]